MSTPPPNLSLKKLAVALQIDPVGKSETQLAAAIAAKQGGVGRSVNGITRVNSRTLRNTFSDATTQDVLIPGPRGAWAANTDYLQGDTYIYQSQLWMANTDHNSGATWNAANSTLSVAAITGPAGANPFIKTGLTGGTPGNLVIQLPGTTTCIDAHPSMVTQLRVLPLYWLGLDGNYYRSGATVPGFSNLVSGRAVCLIGKTPSSTVNWTTFDLAGGIPALYDYTATQMYVAVGFVGGTTTIEFDAPLGNRLSDGTTGTQIWDNFDGYGNTASGQAPASFTAKYGQQWAADDGSNSLTLQGTGPDYLLQENPNTFAKHMVVRKDLTAIADGETYGEFQLFGNSAPAGIIRAGLRIGGAAGSESGLVLEMDKPAGKLNLVKLVAGASTTLATATVAVDVTQRSRWTFSARGSRVVASYWLAANAEPATPQIEYYTDYLNAGLMGIGATQAFFNVYGMGFSTGPAAAPRA